MKWLLTRLLAGVAAIAVVLAGAGALLAHQFSGRPAPWASSQGADAAWVASWSDTAALERVLGTGGVDTVYVYAGDIDGKGRIERVEDTSTLLSWLGREHPNVRALAWLRHVESGSSLIRDRLDRQARETLAPAVAAVAADGFAGVHLEIRPVTVNDPSMPALMSLVREELGEETVLSVQSHHVELVPGGRMPSFVVEREEKYWSKGYLERVSEHADEVVLPGVGSGMPGESLYGGFMVRQVTEAVTALRGREDVALRFGLPTYGESDWAPEGGQESVVTALAAVRLGMTKAEVPEGMTLGVAFYLGDEAREEDVAAYTAGWLPS